MTKSCINFHPIIINCETYSRWIGKLNQESMASRIQCESVWSRISWFADTASRSNNVAVVVARHTYTTCRNKPAPRYRGGQSHPETTTPHKKGANIQSGPFKSAWLDAIILVTDGGVNKVFLGFHWIARFTILLPHLTQNKTCRQNMYIWYQEIRLHIFHNNDKTESKFIIYCINAAKWVFVMTV